MSKLKTIRKELGITQAELAKKLGLGQSTINNYENGNRAVNTATGWQIVQALNSLGAKCSLEDVFPNPQTNNSNT